MYDRERESEREREDSRRSTLNNVIPGQACHVDVDVDVGVDHAQALETLDLAFVNEFRCRLCLKNRDGNTAKERERETDAGSCRRPPEALPFLTHQLDFNHIHKCVCIPVHTHTHTNIFIAYGIYIYLSLFACL